MFVVPQTEDWERELFHIPETENWDEEIRQYEAEQTQTVFHALPDIQLSCNEICFGDDCVPTITLCGPERLILSLQKWKKLTEESKSIFVLPLRGKSEESEWCLGGYFYVTILNDIVDIRKRNKVGEDVIDSKPRTIVNLQ
ncbi:hypothetical protein DPMN_056227 [Dreissena polymorpha]|uniref:Uncharacterized protein n=1 Tax=Dreissena polymorpha TaxID=45954 RepID=A0A9D4CSU3_DREPO|nr:hypothetical protein DPMN_056227 [Dreissena polymorpha]